MKEKKPFTAKRWHDAPLGKIISNNNPSEEELKKLHEEAKEMEQRMKNKQKKDTKKEK